MFGQNNIICLAGMNKCSIDFLKFISSKISKKNILVLPSKRDKGVDTWQPSLRKYAKKNKYRIVSINQIYKIKNLIFISIEYDLLIDIKKFLSKELFNFHFSLLPKYRGCHTNFFQIFYGEKVSGVTLHKIDKGIDTGPIIAAIKFKIDRNTNAFENYNKLMTYSLKLFKKNFKNIINKKYIAKKQKLNKGSYFSKLSVNYNKMKYFKLKKITQKNFNQIKAFIFPPMQLPFLNNKKISDIRYVKNNNIKISYD